MYFLCLIVLEEAVSIFIITLNFFFLPHLSAVTRILTISSKILLCHILVTSSKIFFFLQTNIDFSNKIPPAVLGFNFLIGIFRILVAIRILYYLRNVEFWSVIFCFSLIREGKLSIELSLFRPYLSRFFISGFHKFAWNDSRRSWHRTKIELKFHLAGTTYLHFDFRFFRTNSRSSIEINIL